MHRFSALYFLFNLLIFAAISGCSKETPLPTSEEHITLAHHNQRFVVKQDSIGVRREKRARKNEINVSKGSTIISSTHEVVSSFADECHDIVDVYYNIYTLEVVYVVYIRTECSDANGGDGGGGGSGGGGGGSPGDGSPTSAPTVVLNISLTPCQTAVYNNLTNLNNGMLAFIVQKFGGTATGYNWILRNGTLPIGTYGSTGPYNRGNLSITTSFDANQWRAATDLSLARTMMHEAIHAYLLTYFANDPQYAGVSYPDLIAAYVAYGGADPNIPHHNVMGQQGWLGDLAWGLQQYGENQGYNLPAQYYADMAWGGLERSQEFLALSLADKNRIKDLLRVESTGRDQQGNSQPQSGHPAGCP